MIFHDVIQNSDEWFNLRTGMVTTSNFGKFMANYDKSFGVPAVKYAFKIAKEQVTGVRVDEDSYSNQYMENGHIWEPVANEEYQEKTFYKVDNGGFCEHDIYKNVGGSPDGLIPSFNGGIEIKSVIDFTHRTNIKRNSFDPAYRWQILGNIWLCNLEWLDFISYGYNYPDGKKLFVHRVYGEEYKSEIDLITPRLESFLELIEKEKQYIK